MKIVGEFVRRLIKEGWIGRRNEIIGRKRNIGVVIGKCRIGNEKERIEDIVNEGIEGVDEKRKGDELEMMKVEDINENREGGKEGIEIKEIEKGLKRRDWIFGMERERLEKKVIIGEGKRILVKNRRMNERKWENIGEKMIENKKEENIGGGGEDGESEIGEGWGVKGKEIIEKCRWVGEIENKWEESKKKDEDKDRMIGEEIKKIVEGKRRIVEFNEGVEVELEGEIEKEEKIEKEGMREGIEKKWEKGERCEKKK